MKTQNPNQKPNKYHQSVTVFGWGEFLLKFLLRGTRAQSIKDILMKSASTIEIKYTGVYFEGTKINTDNKIFTISGYFFCDKVLNKPVASLEDKFLAAEKKSNKFCSLVR